MTTRQITEPEFGDLLRTFKQSAFRLETRDYYALDYEQAEFDRFLAGTPVPPPMVSWWQPWLKQIQRLTREGKTIGRVRILAEPPTGYQRWLLWADPWHATAGENIRYMPRRKAYDIGLPDTDWWLLDDERVILMWFTETGEIERKTLTNDPGIVARYRTWRDLAVCHATPAGQTAAA